MKNIVKYLLVWVSLMMGIPGDAFSRSIGEYYWHGMIQFTYQSHQEKKRPYSFYGQDVFVGPYYLEEISHPWKLYVNVIPSVYISLDVIQNSDQQVYAVYGVYFCADKNRYETVEEVTTHCKPSDVLTKQMELIDDGIQWPSYSTKTTIDLQEITGLEEAGEFNIEWSSFQRFKNWNK
ncbi:MAG: hypothetical protein R3A11_06745 [Bdellovibrionota bacterium]